MKRLFLIGLYAGLLTACADAPPKADKAIRIRWAIDPDSLDPMAQPTQGSTDSNNLLNLSLLQVDYSKQTYSPCLAESLPSVRLVGDSLTLLSYRLRSAATWDNGQPVLARDVSFTLKLMQVPGLPNEGARSQFSFIRELRLDSVDPRRFTLVCRGQAPEFVRASGDFFILPEGILDPNGTLRPYRLANLIDQAATAHPDSGLVALARRYTALAPGQHPERVPGCGAYRLVRWEKDHLLDFKRKAHWWADQLRPTPLVLQAHPKQLDFLIIPDDASAALALRRGDIDLYPQVPAREFDRLRHAPSAQQTLAFYTTLSHDVVIAGFNTRRPTLTDRLTRQALSLLFDPVALLQATQQGLGGRTVGIISPTDTRNYADSLPLPAYDPVRTATLLHQAGWRGSPGTGWTRVGGDGLLQRLVLQLRYRADESIFTTIGLQFRAAAAQLGINVELHPTEGGLLTPALQAGDFDVYINRIRGNPFVLNFAPILHSRAIGEGNLTGFGTPASDRLIEAITIARTPVVKARMLRKFQALLQDEMPLVPLFFLPNRIAASRQLSHLYPSSVRPGYAAATILRADAPPVVNP